MFPLSGKKHPVFLPNRCGSHLRQFLLNFCLPNLTGMGANKVVELKILSISEINLSLSLFLIPTSSYVFKQELL